MLLWAVIQLIASKCYDMRTSVDSALYIEGAEGLLNGQFPKGREVLYFSYIFILAVVSLVGLEPEYVIYFHFLSAIIAIYCTYQLAKKITNNSPIAILSPLLYVMWFKFQQWNLIVYTDAIFSHLVVISCYALVKAKTTKQKIISYLLVVFTSFIRPTGLGLLVAVLIYLIKRFNKSKFKRNQKWLLAIFLISMFVIILNLALRNFIDSFIESYKMAEIIYPKIRILVDKPSFLEIPSTEHQPLIRLFLFIFHNPIYFIKISLLKGVLFVGHIKPYYSTTHNIIIASFLYPIYFFTIKGYLIMKKSSIKSLITSFLAFQFLTVCLTSENWDGRFLLPTLPLVFILASLGVSFFWNKKLNNPNKE